MPVLNVQVESHKDDHFEVEVEMLAASRIYADPSYRIRMITTLLTTL
jgi:hypothetical protein